MEPKTCVRATTRIFSSFSSPMVEKMSWWLRETACTSVAALTVAKRGMSYITANSPKNAPFLNCDLTTSRPSTILMASQTPCSTMKSSSPISPCVMMFVPLEKVIGFSMPTSRYCSAFDSTSRENRGILEMCCRSSWRAAMTSACGNLRSLTSVSATNVFFARAFLLIKHSAPKYMPGSTCSGALISSRRSSCIVVVSLSYSTTFPDSKTNTESMCAPLAKMTSHFVKCTSSALRLIGWKKVSANICSCGICLSRWPFMASASASANSSRSRPLGALSRSSS
mmetsp:Transcript_106179/g.338161  ORF Transcript_106179/g.338161 Transcript_106179/m.338161 type:complete len:282 (+) Transcript_106179:766-1611(+)